MRVPIVCPARHGDEGQQDDGAERMEPGALDPRIGQIGKERGEGAWGAVVFSAGHAVLRTAGRDNDEELQSPWPPPIEALPRWRRLCKVAGASPVRHLSLFEYPP